MRNPELDEKLPIDKNIGELKDGVRIVDGKEIIQIEEKTQADRDLNLIINRYRLGHR